MILQAGSKTHLFLTPLICAPICDDGNPSTASSAASRESPKRYINGCIKRVVLRDVPGWTSPKIRFACHHKTAALWHPPTNNKVHQKLQLDPSIDVRWPGMLPPEQWLSDTWSTKDWTVKQSVFQKMFWFSWMNHAKHCRTKCCFVRNLGLRWAGLRRNTIKTTLRFWQCLEIEVGIFQGPANKSLKLLYIYI